jgi:TonB family protein
MLARMGRVKGVVVLDVTIDPSGKVREAIVLQSIPMLDEAAIDAVMQWEYTPTLLNGAAVPVVMTVSVNFTL